MMGNPVYVVYPSNQWNNSTHGARVNLLRQIGLNQKFIGKYSRLGWDSLHPAIQQRINAFYGRAEQNPSLETPMNAICPNCGNKLTLVTTHFGKQGAACKSCGWPALIKERIEGPDKNPQHLDQRVIEQRMWNHELMRINTMSKSALLNRIYKITHPDKMMMFIRALRTVGYNDLVAEAEKQLRQIYECNPSTDKLIGTWEMDRFGSIILKFSDGKSVYMQGDDAEQFLKDSGLSDIGPGDWDNIRDDSIIWEYYSVATEQNPLITQYKGHIIYQKSPQRYLVGATRPTVGRISVGAFHDISTAKQWIDRGGVEQNPSRGVDYDWLVTARCSECGYKETKVYDDKDVREIQNRGGFTVLCPNCRADGAIGADALKVIKVEKIKKRTEQNPLTPQEIRELESQRDSFMEEMDEIESKPMPEGELTRHAFLRGKAEAINQVINAYDGRLNTPQEMGKWAEHKVMEQNPAEYALIEKKMFEYLLKIPEWINHPAAGRHPKAVRNRIRSLLSKATLLWTDALSQVERVEMWKKCPTVAKVLGGHKITIQELNIAAEEIKRVQPTMIVPSVASESVEEEEFGGAAPVEQNPDHDTGIEDRQGKWVAWCTCGWTSKGYSNVPSAMRARTRHKKESEQRETMQRLHITGMGGTEQNPKRKSLQYYDITFAGVPRTQAGIERFIVAAKSAGYSVEEISNYLKAEQNPLTTDEIIKKMKFIIDLSAKEYEKYNNIDSLKLTLNTLQRLYGMWDSLTPAEQDANVNVKQLLDLLYMTVGSTIEDITATEQNPRIRIYHYVCKNCGLYVPKGGLISGMPKETLCKEGKEHEFEKVYDNEQNPLTSHDFKEALEGEGWAIGDYKDMISKSDSLVEQQQLKHILKEEQEHQDELIDLMQCSYPPTYEENHTIEQIAIIGLPRAAIEDLQRGENAIENRLTNIAAIKLQEVEGYWNRMSEKERKNNPQIKIRMESLEQAIFDRNFGATSIQFVNWLGSHGYNMARFFVLPDDTRETLIKQYTFETGEQFDIAESNTSQNYGTLHYENNPTEAEEIPQMDDEPEESGIRETLEVEVPKVPGVSEQETINALEAYQKFHDFAPVKIEEIDIPHPKIIAKLGDFTACGYFGPKWKFKRKLKQRRGRNKGQHYIHEYQDTQNDADSMVGFAPDAKGDTGLVMAWRRCRLTAHGIEDLR